MDIFKASDIVEFAVRIEENGERFYRWAAVLARDEETKAMFESLADAETVHKRRFEKLRAAAEQALPPETYDGEYAAYLHNYVDGNIIFDAKTMGDELAKIPDIRAAIDFAIRRELDSMLYYHEIKRFVPEREHRVLDEIIEEERTHFTGLSNLRRRCA